MAGKLREVIGDSGQVLLRLDGEANEDSYRKEARAADLVHLSCHAQLAEPAYLSRLVLAPFGQQDGLLTAAEAADVKLSDALVFLGACRTGMGRVTADGVIGLGRAFLEAGARSVILSLWNAQDDAARSLAANFYDALFHPNTCCSSAEALRQSMVKTRDDLAAGRITSDGEPLDNHPRY